MLAIENAAFYVPDNFLAIEHASSWLGISPIEAKIYHRVFGLENFPVAKDTTVNNLLQKAIAQLAISETAKSSIKLIIHAHTAQVLCPFGNSVINDIRQQFKLQHCYYMGTSLNNCASIFNALEIANSFLADFAEQATALIIVGEITFTQSLRLVPKVSVTGDAAAALLVNNYSSAHRLLAMTITCHGEYAKGLWLNNVEHIKFEANFSLMVRAAIAKTLRKANITINDIALILPHNINLRVWRVLAQDLNLAKDTIFIENIKKYAHCFGADVIINFVSAQINQRLKKGDYYLLVTIGLGATIGVAVFRY